jgi:predicted unusual protein kinase regulating ubiquinone biosynthesis (AarF/ABC1/UbiB family)
VPASSLPTTRRIPTDLHFCCNGQSMTDDGPGKHLARSSPVPSSRLSRLARLGSLATGVAGGMLAEGARQLARGQRPRIRDMLLTPGNARQVTEQLARLRGAAMKVGQLLSMDAGELLRRS